MKHGLISTRCIASKQAKEKIQGRMKKKWGLPSQPINYNKHPVFFQCNFPNLICFISIYLCLLATRLQMLLLFHLELLEHTTFPMSPGISPLQISTLLEKYRNSLWLWIDQLMPMISKEAIIEAQTHSFFPPPLTSLASTFRDGEG